MNLQDLKDKLVAVLGYGTEGKAVAAYLIKHGIKPVLFDQKPWAEWSAGDQLAIKKLEVNFIFGPDCFKELTGFGVVFRSPGISHKKLQAVNYKLSAITSQTKWFFEHCPAKIIGVTGTKGKGTTAALIYEMLGLQSQISNLKSKIHLTGNIGKIQPLEILDNLTADDWVVYELSSFQLQDLTQSPHIGVALMITSEHLDYHQDHKEYVEAKSAITKFQKADDAAVINADFKNSINIGKLGNGKKLYFSRRTEVEKDCYIRDGDIVIARSDFRLPTSDLQLRGEHNWENIMAAILAARAAGASDDAIKQAIKNFKGLEHRLEFVAERNGVKFYNDSFSTIPETAIAAINSFKEPEILILGGSGKKSDFSELGKTIQDAKNIKAAILIGEEAPRIKQKIHKFAGQILEGAKSMDEIFVQIKSVAAKGNVVILTPACASFDMFKNYQDRGVQFKNSANQF